MFGIHKRMLSNYDISCNHFDLMHNQFPQPVVTTVFIKIFFYGSRFVPYAAERIAMVCSAPVRRRHYWLLPNRRKLQHAKNETGTQALSIIPWSKFLRGDPSAGVVP